MSHTWYFLEDESTQTVIYVPVNQTSLMAFRLSEEEQIGLLKKLLIALLSDQAKKTFCSHSAQGFFLEVRSARKKQNQDALEISFRVMDLSQTERGFRSLGLLLDLAAVSGEERLTFRYCTEDPILLAQEKRKRIKPEPEQAKPLEKKPQMLETKSMVENKSTQVERTEIQRDETPKQQSPSQLSLFTAFMSRSQAWTQPLMQATKKEKKLKIPHIVPDHAVKALEILKEDFKKKFQALKMREKCLQAFYEELIGQGFQLKKWCLPQKAPSLLKNWHQRFLEELQAVVQGQASTMGAPMPDVQEGHDNNKQQRQDQFKTVEDWLVQLKTQELELIHSEMKDFDLELAAWEGWLHSFREAFLQKKAEFSDRLNALTLLEGEVAAIKMTPLLKRRMNLKLIDCLYDEFLQGEGERSQTKIQWQRSFDAAMGLPGLTPVLGDLHIKKRLDQNVHLLFLDMDCYQKKLIQLVSAARDLPQIESVYQLVQQALEMTRRLWKWIDEILARNNAYWSEAILSDFYTIKQSIEIRGRILRSNQINLLVKTGKDAEEMRDYIEGHTLSVLKKLQDQILTLEIQMGVLASCSKRSEEKLDTFDESRARLVQSQTRLLLAIQHAVTQVTFWNKQVSDLGGKKVLVQDVQLKTFHPVSVPDGIQDMLIVLNEKKWSVPEKLEKIKELALRRLRRQGFFSEKPWLRRQGTQEFYKLVASLQLAQADQLTALSGLLESFVESHSIATQSFVACKKSP